MSSPFPRVEPLTGRIGPRRVNDKLMALIMVGLLFTVGAVLLARLNQQVVVTATPTAAVSQSRALLFEDLEQGRIVVIDADTGAEVVSFARGEGSFVRGVVRSLVRSRNLARTSVRTPFLLNAYQDGRLILSDPVTNQAIELQAFGPTNSGVFRAMLPAGAAADLSSPASVVFE